MKNKIGVYICHCGSNISDYVDVKKLNEITAKIEGVNIAKDTMFACADSTQKEIIDDIKSNELDSIVIASCSPKLHLETFRNVAIRAGLNPYNYVQVNIREQCSWAHSDDKKGATLKALQLVKAGIERVKRSQALEPIEISSRNVVLIVGAGVAGMRSAIELADMGTEVYLIEREYFVGGRTSQWNTLFTTDETGEQVIKRLYKKVISYKSITLFTGAEIVSKSGGIGKFDIKLKIKPRHIKPNCELDWKKFDKAVSVCPIEVEDEFNFGLTKRKAIFMNYKSEFPQIPAIDTENCNRCGECVKICPEIDLDQKDEILNIKVGAILLTTGADPYEPKKDEYGYKTLDNVITLQQLKRLIELNDDKNLSYKGKKIKDVAFIYCVGSRQEEGGNTYCSRYCCTSAIHSAILLKNKYRDIRNYHINRGIRTYGKQELLYKESSENGDIYLQFFEDKIPTVEKSKNGATIKVIDILTTNREIELEADLVVLVTGMVPRKDNTIAGILKVPIGRDKFFNEIHPKLRPVETVIDAVYIAGACQAPRTIRESIDSALSATAKANSLISKGKIDLEPTLAQIDTSTCEWCGKCVDVCPYSAIKKVEKEGKQIAEIIESNCKGCGMCMPVCPSNSIQLIGYTDTEIESMIEALIS
ncbi:MAG: CoB--CoM heterodisulfide reductase iron-sulfur subunit A family protein [Bacteroidales bacterium]|nr:CoB--CoM heterodisulfide reductase iron-sulfur subunit A family protein [Bacteroidales bacterium]